MSDTHCSQHKPQFPLTKFSETRVPVPAVMPKCILVIQLFVLGFFLVQDFLK